MESCPDHLNVPMKFSDIELTRPKNGEFNINGKITIEKLINGPLTLTLQSMRCDTLTKTTENCENFNDYRFTNFCNQLQMKNIIWYPFISKIEPRLTCPFKPGIYYLRNGSFDLSMFLKMPIEGYSWVVNSKLVHELKNGLRELVTCISSRANIGIAKTKN